MYLYFNQKLKLLREVWCIFPVLLAILVGGGVGGLAVIANNVSSKWAMAIILAVIAPSVVLLVNDIKKLILLVLVLDMPFRIDIAIQNQGWHRGGPTGYIVSLTTISLTIGYALWLIEQKPKPQFFPEVSIPALLYLFMIVISFFQSPNLQLSAFGLFLQCQAFLMYFYIVNHVKTWSDIRLIVTTAVTCLLLESVLMVLQYFTGATLDIGGLITSEALTEGGAGVTGVRVSGTLGRPGNAALYLNSMLALTLGAYLTGKLVDKRLALGALSLGVIALIGTSSRGGWVAFVVAMPLIISRAAWTGAGKKAAWVFLVGGLLIGLFWGQIQQRLLTIQDDKTREQLDTMAYNIIEAYPLGVGENTYDLHMSDKYAHPNMVGHHHLPVHNRYLLVWAETGLQGLAAFGLLLIAPFWQAKRWLFRIKGASHLVILGTSLLSGLVTHIVHMRSENFNGRVQIQLLWFLIAMVVVVNQLITQTEPDTMVHNGVEGNQKLATSRIGIGG